MSIKTRALSLIRRCYIVWVHLHISLWEVLMTKAEYRFTFWRIRLDYCDPKNHLFPHAFHRPLSTVQEPTVTDYDIRSEVEC